MNKLIIVTGAQGVGKSFYTNWLREQMRYTNLMRLTGTADKTITGRDKQTVSYFNMINYLHSMEDCDFNFIFDGFYMSEDAFCRAGYKEYLFNDVSDILTNKLVKLKYDTYLINLVCNNEVELTRRLQRSKPGFLDRKFLLEESILQQRVYTDIANELSTHINTHIVDTSSDIECKEILSQILF